MACDRSQMLFVSIDISKDDEPCMAVATPFASKALVVNCIYGEEVHELYDKLMGPMHHSSKTIDEIFNCLNEKGYNK